MKFGKTIRMRMLVLIGLTLYAGPALSQPNEIEMVAKLPAQIAHVESGGYWSKGHEEGFFRIVVTSGGVEHVSNKLFVQVLKVDANTQSYKIVNTLPINETNHGEGNVLNVATEFGDINAFEVNVEANKRGGQTKRFKLILNGSGGYKLKKQK